MTRGGGGGTSSGISGVVLACARAQADTSGAASAATRIHAVIPRRISSLWQQDPERRPGPGCGLYLNVAVVHLDRPVHHRQPDPAASLFRREIKIEDFLQMLGADADA